MGRPLNNRFFGDGAGLIACEVYSERAGASAAGYIISQRSNSAYEVGDETLTDVDVDNLVIGSIYEIAVAGTTDWVAAGSADNAVGTRFTAATAASDGTGTAREIIYASLQAAAITAAGQMRVAVTPDNAQGVVQATVSYTLAGDALSTVAIANAGYGYWSPATNVAVAGGTGGTIDYTVANGSLATVTPNTGGSGYTGTGPDNIADAPDADPPVEYARIINAKRVKTFPQLTGNTYVWPIVGTDDGPGPSGIAEADLGTQ